MKSLLSLLFFFSTAQSLACDGNLVLTQMGNDLKAQLIHVGEVYDCQKTWVGKNELICRTPNRISFNKLTVVLDEQKKNFQLLSNNIEKCVGVATTINKVSSLSYKACSSLRGGLTPIEGTVKLNDDYSCGPIQSVEDWAICQAENPTQQNSFVIHTDRLGRLMMSGETPLESNAFIQYCY